MSLCKQAGYWETSKELYLPEGCVSTLPLPGVLTVPATRHQSLDDRPGSTLAQKLDTGREVTATREESKRICDDASRSVGQGTITTRSRLRHCATRTYWETMIKAASSAASKPLRGAPSCITTHAAKAARQASQPALWRRSLVTAYIGGDCSSH